MSGSISKHFSWHEATYLPTWAREATADDGLNDEVKANLVEIFSRLDAVRDHFGVPIMVHVAFRPAAYNAEIGGAKNSAHMTGEAVDFHCEGLDCDDVRKAILDAGLLDSLDLRMEMNDGGNWVHLDKRTPLPGHSRYFQP